MIIRQPSIPAAIAAPGSLVALFACAVAGALGPAGSAGDGGLPTGAARVSGASPFSADCNGSGWPISAAYVNAEVEPYLAVNPRNTRELIAVYQQDRYADDGANGVLAATSFDGGRSWQVPALADQPPFSRCAGGDANHGGDFELASDPWIDIGPDGIAYFAALGFNKSNPDTAELVSVSMTGGRKWQRPVAVIRENTANVSDERPAVTADPGRARTAYLVWARQRTAPAEAVSGAAWFSRTTDGGQTWSAPRAIYETPRGLQTSANQVAALPNGDLVDVFTELGLDAGSRHPRQDRIALMRSTDAGQSWSPPATLATSNVTGVTDPRSGALIRAGDSFTDVAVDPRPGTGTLYVVWADARFSAGRIQQIVLARSTDGGRSWAEPVAVAAGTGAQQFVPAVAVNERGDVAVTFYAIDRDAPRSGPLPTQYWIAVSPDQGRSFSAPRPLARGFDLRTAPFNGGLFLGEYQGLAAAGMSFIAVAALANGHDLGNRTDIYSNAAER